MIKQVTTAVALLVSAAAFSQVGVNTEAPKTTMDISAKRNSGGVLTDNTQAHGLQAPRLTRAELTSNTATYGADQKGALIFVTDISGGNISGQRANVTSAGYYYFDGALWIRLTDRKVDLRLVGTDNHITQDAGVGINGTSVGTGQNNIGIGRSTLSANTTGNSNLAVGTNALRDNTIGLNNIAVGGNALLVNTTGDSNMAFGVSALTSNTTGTRNTAIGQNTLTANISGSDNISVGQNSLANNTASNNIAIGINALQVNTSGTANTAIGRSALDDKTTGNNNTAFGYRSGSSLTSGSDNIFIGANTFPNVSPTASNQLNIGNWIYGNAGLIGIGSSATKPIANLDVRGAVRGGSPHADEVSGASAIGLRSVAFGSANRVSGATSGAIGSGNQVAQDYAVALGTLNTISNTSKWGSVAFGQENTVTALLATASGNRNTVSGDLSVAFGNQNQVSGSSSAVLSGGYNTNAGTSSAIVSGANNTITGDVQDAAILGGVNNTINGVGTIGNVILGGRFNFADGQYTTVAGGQNNRASGKLASVSGGEYNWASSYGEWAGGVYSTTYTPVSTTTWQAKDRLFTIGNGTNVGSSTSDAFTILKDATTGIGFKNFETTAFNEKLQVNGNARFAALPSVDGNIATDKIVVVNADGVLKTISTSSLGAAAIRTATADYTALATDETILVNASSGAVTINLPATPTVGKRYNVKKVDNTANAVNVSGNGHNIDGSASISGTVPYQGWVMQYDGSNWFIISKI